MRFLKQPTRLLFFTGKGGVGKTSLACATAVTLADEGRKVLLVSTDPASNLGQVFGVTIGEHEPTPIPGVTGLFALNINPEAAAQAYRDRIIGPVRDILPAETVKGMEEQLSGACTTEIAAFDEFTGLLTDGVATGNYDHVIFDTAPTGHTLRLLQLPTAWSNFLETNESGASCLGPLSGLEKQRQQYAHAVAELANASTTTVVLVSRPQRASLAEADRTSHELATLGIVNQQLVINGGMPDIGRGNAWDEKDEFDKALADYNEALRLDPKNSLAYNNRGLLWQKRGEVDKALADYNEAIRLDPKDSLAYINRGVLWKARGEFDKALADYNEAIRLDPKYSLVYNNRGILWGKRGEVDKALADYNEAIRLDPKDSLAYVNRSLLWSERGQFDKALADYKEALQADPKYGNAHNGLAWLMATCPQARYRDGRKAVEHATKACELSAWKDGNKLDTLAAAYAEAGDFMSAIRWQSKALELYVGGDKGPMQSRLELYRSGKPYREAPVQVAIPRIE